MMTRSGSAPDKGLEMTKTCGETFVNFDRKIHQVLFYLGQQTRRRKNILITFKCQMFTDYIAISIGCYCERESLPKSVKFYCSNNHCFSCFY